ncbi:MAG: alpha/beta hydrolase [Planctomycetia bacterium]
MLFITNRSLKQTLHSSANRKIDFDLGDTNPLRSVFFCRRNGAGDYVEVLSEPFFKELQAANVDQILLFIHGFNSLPENAIFQRAERLQSLIDGMQSGGGCSSLVVPLIWPCRDETARNVIKRYDDDAAAAKGSAVAFARALAFFQDFQSDQSGPCLKRISVLAHSMGNRVLRETLLEWCNEIRRFEPPMLFRSIFMVAADVVNQTLEPNHSGNFLTAASRNVVVYYAADDLALRGSKLLNARDVSRRLGHTGPIDMAAVPANVWSVDCDDFNLVYDKSFGHTYFLDDDQNKPGKVVKNIYETLRSGRPSQENAAQVLSPRECRL